MPRELSEVEKLYIEEHYLDEGVEVMANKMKGIGPVTVECHVKTLPPPGSRDESPEERTRKLQSTKVSGSRLMGRDPKRGVTVMTEAASELIDARATVALPEVTKKRKEKMRGQIHKPFEDSEYDR